MGTPGTRRMPPLLRRARRNTLRCSAIAPLLRWLGRCDDPAGAPWAMGTGKPPDVVNGYKWELFAHNRIMSSNSSTTPWASQSQAEERY